MAPFGLASLTLILVMQLKAWSIVRSARFPPWDHLSVTWGKFSGLPKLEDDARKDNWKLIEDGCQSKGTFLGKRYIKDGDYTVVLVFTVNGDLAGIQMGMPENTALSQARRPPFVLYQGKLFLTALFMPAGDVCNKHIPVDKDYLGTKLLILTSADGTRAMEIPLREQELTSTKWVQGKCFKSMGHHYWYDISKTMDCRDFVPVFILYNKGYLNAFGWAMQAIFTSPRMENPANYVLGHFFHGHNHPTCLTTGSSLSTQHIFLESNASLNAC